MSKVKIKGSEEGVEFRGQKKIDIWNAKGMQREGGRKEP